MTDAQHVIVDAIVTVHTDDDQEAEELAEEAVKGHLELDNHEKVDAEIGVSRVEVSR